jgi:hypothetical protein
MIHTTNNKEGKTMTDDIRIRAQQAELGIYAVYVNDVLYKGDMSLSEARDYVKAMLNTDSIYDITY